MLPIKYSSSLLLMASFCLVSGCSSYQPTKEVWKGTKSLWYTYASPPASVDYEDKGDISAGSLQLAQSMLSIDGELSRLERVMLNADKPPTQEWITNFTLSFPWIGGIAGVKYDGTILGQEPPVPQKELDYIPLLYEDPKQKRNALRGDVQITPQGPEVLLAAPLYESTDFLGIVCAHFDMRTLATQASNIDRLVILSPQGLLWAGTYDFAKTPLAGLDWAKICRESSSGSCVNAMGKFLYQVRYLGNLPLIFAVAEEGAFPEGNGSVEQGLAFFPKEREKLPPPPQPERKEKTDKGVPVFGQSAEPMMPDLPRPGEEVALPVQEHTGSKNNEEIEQGSRKSPLLRAKTPRRGSSAVRERTLEGENVEIQRINRPQQRKPVQVKPDLDLGPDVQGPTLPGGRPSPFGAGTSSTPKQETPAATEPVQPSTPQTAPSDTLPGGRPSPFGNASGAEQSKPAGESKPAPTEEAKPAPATEQQGSGQPEKTPETPTLPGGRPSPFGS